jgi:hypothetical protein
MDVHCGVEYDINTPPPAKARFGLWYRRCVRYFMTGENAEQALRYLEQDDRQTAFIQELKEDRFLSLKKDSNERGKGLGFYSGFEG